MPLVDTMLPVTNIISIVTFSECHEPIVGMVIC
jgi:hypothetical protein